MLGDSASGGCRRRSEASSLDVGLFVSRRRVPLGLTLSLIFLRHVKSRQRRRVQFLLETTEEWINGGASTYSTRPDILSRKAAQLSRRVLVCMAKPRGMYVSGNLPDLPAQGTWTVRYP